MSNAVVTSLTLQSGPRGEAEITITRRAVGEWPSSDDLPGDMRAALLEWLGVDEPADEGRRNVQR